MKQPAASNPATDDTSCSLSALRAQAGKPLFHSILELYAHRWTVNDKSTEFLRNLKCFLPADPGSKRRLHTRHGVVKTQLKLCSSAKGYVAVSYPWGPSEGEDESIGRYQPPPKMTVSTMVRDIVLDRTFHFIRYKDGSGGMRPLWIDQLSIDQDNSREKEIGMQSMDLVYKRCAYAVGYLWVQIQTQIQADRLSDLLGGRIVRYQPNKQRPVLEKGIDAKVAHEVLDVLVQITDDQWWSRAWIFQEDYLAGTKMWLLMRHGHGIHKRGELGSLPGELVVKSEKFKRCATLMCLACYSAMGQDYLMMRKCMKILRKAGKYNILHKYHRSRLDENAQKPMTISILRGLSNREMKVRADILAIAANVCSYDIRLPETQEIALKSSLSLDILTLYLSNGEMIKNGRGESDLEKTIFDFLKSESISISTPLPDGELTMAKHCRLSVHKLSFAGIHTKGILWKLGDIIPPGSVQQSSSSKSKIPSQRNIYRKGLDDYQKSRLLDLLRVLIQRMRQRKERYKRLADDLAAYLKHSEPSMKHKDWPPRYSMDLMAACVVDAMDTGKYLQLARPIGGLPGHGRGIPYRAILTRDHHDVQEPGPTYVFTSWTRTKEQTRGEMECKRLAKYVSLNVDVDERAWDGTAKLRSKRWVNGLCFFDGEMKFPFVFAWPESLCQ